MVYNIKKLKEKGVLVPRAFIKELKIKRELEHISPALKKLEDEKFLQLKKGKKITLGSHPRIIIKRKRSYTRIVKGKRRRVKPHKQSYKKNYGMGWVVREKGTGKKIAGPFKTFSRASSKRDKLDDEYGAYHYAVMNESTNPFKKTYGSKSIKDLRIENMKKAGLSFNEIQKIMETTGGAEWEFFETGPSYGSRGRRPVKRTYYKGPDPEGLFDEDEKQRKLEMFEKEGIVYTKPGKGGFKVPTDFKNKGAREEKKRLKFFKKVGYKRP